MNLEQQLVALGREIDWPDTERTLLPIASSRSRRRAWLVPTLAAFAALVIALTPGARRAVANLLELAGIRIEFGTSEQLELDPDLLLGEVVAIADAQAAVDFPLKRPSILDGPDAVTVYRGSLGSQVFMGWFAGNDLPAVGASELGLLLTQFRGNFDDPFVEKLLGEGTRVTRVEVGSVLGYWLEGAPHSLMYHDGERLIEDSARLAGNVLVWETNGVTYRLESALTLEMALAIAESLVQHFPS